jgi:hypothetical protein
MQTKDKIYGNCSVFSPDNILMFRCNQKKALWYLNRNLAEKIQEEPLIIRLNFTPNGLGNHNKGYGLSEMKNICINCGSTKNLTRHHVVPISYRRYFPVEVKSHNFHDVLPMCTECHETYERKADVLKKYLAEKYDAPINGLIQKDGTKIKMMKFIKLAHSLLNDKIPKKYIRKSVSQLKTEFNVKRLTKSRLTKISEMKIEISRKGHSELVMSKINDTIPFIEMWRKHFLENNECKFLPDEWKIDYQK